jgi:hypothetical protein
MKYRSLFASVFTLFLSSLGLFSQEGIRGEKRQEFLKLNKANWEEAFFDSCTENWKDKWALDGLKATISNSEAGMDYSAGRVDKEDASHAVLWTKDRFKGDIKIEYEYTRTGTVTRNVTILYIQATGSTEIGVPYNLADWADEREIPAMRTYFNNLNTYHISYAAFGKNPVDEIDDYIRARRYMPQLKKGLTGTAIEPDVFKRTALFAPDVPHHITVIKTSKEIFMMIKNPEKEYLCHWNNTQFPPITEGAIGLRHMFMRSARYKNFRISTLKSN